MGTQRDRRGVHRRKRVHDLACWLSHGRRVPRGAATDIDVVSAPRSGGEVEQVSGVEQPVSLSQLRADDELLAALGRGEGLLRDQEPEAAGNELAVLLRSWRAAIDAEPFPGLDTGVVMAAPSGAKRQAVPRRRRLVLLPVAGAAAGVVVATAALAGVSRTARPGDHLWDVSKVLYADHARSVVAANSAHRHLHEAREAIKAGDPDRARRAVAHANEELSAVNNGEGKASLAATCDALMDRLNMTGARTGRTGSQAAPEGTQATQLRGAEETASPPMSASPTNASAAKPPHTTQKPSPTGDSDGPPAAAPAPSDVPAPPGRAAGTPATHTPTVGPTMPRSVPVRLRVSAIGVNQPLMKLGLNPDRTVEVPPLSEVDTPGWYEYSPAPGEVGPAVILGGIDSAGQSAGVFSRLGSLSRGDQIAVTRADGSVAHFVVYAVSDYSEAHFPTYAVYGDTDRAELRLIGYGGSAHQATHGSRDGIVVSARLVSTSDRHTG